jgi:cytochrome c
VSRAKTHLRGAVVAFAVLLFLPAVQADETHGTAEEAQFMVEQAIGYFDKAGAEAAFAKFNTDPAPSFADRDLYVFVVDDDGIAVAHAADPSQVGLDVAGLKDVDGKMFGQEILDMATPQGAWVDYKWKDPETGNIEPKSSWVVSHEGYIFGVGIYQP